MAFIFKIKLDGSSKPPIWRKIKINELASFYDLHIAIQKAMGWYNEHLYQFSPKGWGTFPTLSDAYEDDWTGPMMKPQNWPHGEKFEASKIRLNQYFNALNQKIVYIYDFGDDWQHTIELLEITQDKTIKPVCLAGKGTCPPEDCGGIGGYYNMVDAINDPSHPHHKNILEWMGMQKGEMWDENGFDLEEVQKRMK